LKYFSALKYVSAICPQPIKPILKTLFIKSF
jgi:hypothetical protein